MAESLLKTWWTIGYYQVCNRGVTCNLRYYPVTCKSLILRNNTKVNICTDVQLMSVNKNNRIWVRLWSNVKTWESGLHGNCLLAPGSAAKNGSGLQSVKPLGSGLQKRTFRAPGLQGPPLWDPAYWQVTFHFHSTRYWKFLLHKHLC